MRCIDASVVKVPLRCSSKREAIEVLLDLLVAQGVVTDRASLLDEILERENLSPTAIGYRAAIPHARSDHVRTTACAFGNTLGQSIDFGCRAGESSPLATDLIFLMVSPRDSATHHIKTLAKIARLVKDERRRESLYQARESEEILELLGDLARPRESSTNV